MAKLDVIVPTFHAAKITQVLGRVHNVDNIEDRDYGVPNYTRLIIDSPDSFRDLHSSIQTLVGGVAQIDWLDEVSVQRFDILDDETLISTAREFTNETETQLSPSEIKALVSELATRLGRK